VGGEVQHFAFLSLARRKHIFDILKMSFYAKADKESGKGNKGCLKELGLHVSRVLSMQGSWGCIPERSLQVHYRRPDDLRSIVR